MLWWTCCLLQANKDQKAVGRLLIILLFEPQVGGCTFPDQVYTYSSSCFKFPAETELRLHLGFFIRISSSKLPPLLALTPWSKVLAAGPAEEA